MGCPFWAATIFGTCGRVADVIIFAKFHKFQENQFRGYGPTDGQKSPLSIDLATV